MITPSSSDDINYFTLSPIERGVKKIVQLNKSIGIVGKVLIV